jgi:hypothetical protein
VDDLGGFQVVHPFHPLRGQRFELVAYLHTWGEHRVFYHDEKGCLRSLPASWTSVVPPDPFVMVSAGRSAFRVGDLLALAALCRELSGEPMAAEEEIREEGDDRIC